MSTSYNFESYPTFFRPNPAVDRAEDPPEYDSEPKSGPEPDPVPVIDFEEMEAEKVSRACREWGMFRLANHGVPAELLSQLDEHAEKLFGLDFEAKQGLPTSPILYFWGSAALTRSGNATQTGPSTRNLSWLEGLNVPLTKISDLRYEDPQLESFRSLLVEYGKHQTRVAKAIFTTMADHLNFPPSKSTSYLSPSTGFLRVYRYLRCPTTEQRWGIDVHTDSSVLSIIHQDQVGGLQVLNNNQWHDVKPINHTLIVNLGDMMQAMSNESFVSAIHRVKVHRDRERISIGYFVFPDDNAVIESSEYRPFTYPDFQAENELDFKTLGKKIGLPRFKKQHHPLLY